MHGHRDMEILTYVLKGSIAHKDSMGHQHVLGPNEIQRMSAGKGIMHSEFNPSESDLLHFFQIWIEPATSGTTPAYTQIRFDPEEKNNRLKQLAGPTGSGSVASINQDAEVYVSELAGGAELPYSLERGRSAWVHVIRGGVNINGISLKTGDAAAVSAEETLVLAGADRDPSEILLFDVV